MDKFLTQTNSRSQTRETAHMQPQHKMVVVAAKTQTQGDKQAQPTTHTAPLTTAQNPEYGLIAKAVAEILHPTITIQEAITQDISNNLQGLQAEVTKNSTHIGEAEQHIETLEEELMQANYYT